MDPLGIGLENFDAIGRWRDTYGVEPIDAFGELADGNQFNGPAELKQILLTRKALFARNFSRKMLSFALGRSIRFQDKRTVDALTNTLLDTDFDSVAFIQAVASAVTLSGIKRATLTSKPKPHDVTPSHNTTPCPARNWGYYCVAFFREPIASLSCARVLWHPSVQHFCLCRTGFTPINGRPINQELILIFLP